MRSQHFVMPPHIIVQYFPTTEIGAIHSIHDNMDQLSALIEDFFTVVQLFTRSEVEIASAKRRHKDNGSPFSGELMAQFDRSVDLPERLIFVAARDAGMTIWHFGNVIVELNKLLQELKSKKETLGQRPIRQALSKFNQAFPLIAGSRDAIAHRAQRSKNQEELKANSTTELIDTPGIKSDGGSVYIECSIAGRQVTHTIKGRVHTYYVDEASLINLIEIRQSVFDAVALLPTVEAAKAEWDERARNGQEQRENWPLPDHHIYD